MKKKILLLSLSAIMACFCCACGNSDDAQSKESDVATDGRACYYEDTFITLYSSSDTVRYEDGRCVNEYPGDHIRNLSMKIGNLYYLCITDYYSEHLGWNAANNGHYCNPAVFDDNGELVSEPSIEYDSEYIEVTSKSNWIQCMYMIKPIKSVEKTTITIPEHTFDDDRIGTEQTLSITIE